MATFSSLYGEHLSRELGSEDSTVLFTTSRRQAAVNQAMREFADLTGCLIRESTITITGGTGEYDLLSTSIIAGGDFVRLVEGKDAVEFHYTDASSYTQYLSGDDLVRRDITWLNQYEENWRGSTSVSSGAQTPSAYYLRANGPALYLGFYPVPSTGSSATAKALVRYRVYPAAMSSTGDEPFTVNSSVRTDLRPFHQGLVHYAAHLLEKYRRDTEASALQLQQFMVYVTRYWQYAKTHTGKALTFSRQYFRQASGLTERPQDPRT